MKLLVAVFIAVALEGSIAEKMRFDNHTLYRFTPNNKDLIDTLSNLEASGDPGYNFFSPIRGQNVPVDLLVAPDRVQEFKTLLEQSNVQSELLVPDIQKLIDNENVKSDRLSGSFDWRQYHTLDEINDWLRGLSDTYPEHVTIVDGGVSYEGRDIIGVKISYSPNNHRHTVFIEANIHAREWITSAVATFVINQLLGNDDPEIRHLAESYDWYIFPVFNPDGFAYSHTTNRLWRKTRQPYSVLCVGADPNRNWPYQWMQGGASNNPCSETYAGPSPLSEPSTLSLSSFINSLGFQIEAYISFHSYSQMLLLPYGHTTDHLDNYEELMIIGEQAIVDLEKRYGTQYVVGNIAETIYVATGGSMDWVKHEYEVPLTYTYELRDTGEYGFLLPAEQILPTALETMDSLVSIFKSYEILHPRGQNLVLESKEQVQKDDECCVGIGGLE
ncbi:hypothetical protein GWI33_016043 [Rhynchophorus ferrugineus]|uniref:Peptidase M14 domain-containing protein n=2 Tax=Rhynchophorus ferrugineus TaxID=354439 RepID=A0A834I1P7_RHYFE|nr:hypothetical protein GWI33_016043 [Rhynchophorus ferrugineus]